MNECVVEEVSCKKSVCSLTEILQHKIMGKVDEEGTSGSFLFD